MAGEYGRGGIAQARSSSGGNDSYDYAAKSAMSYFDKDESAGYQAASANFTTEGISTKKRDRSGVMITRLREVAAMRAMKEWQETVGRFSSDPSRQQRTSGLISSETFGDRMFGNVTAEHASTARDEIGRLQEMGSQNTQLGRGFSSTNQDLNSQLYRQDRYGTVFNMGTKGTVDFGRTYIADAERAYLGMSGGTNTVYRGGANRESASSIQARDRVSTGSGTFRYSGEQFKAVKEGENKPTTQWKEVSGTGKISNKHRDDFDY